MTECFVIQGRPLPLHFLRRNSKAGCVDANVHTMAKYIMELTIIEYSFMHLPPSKLAAASLAIAMKVRDEKLRTKIGNKTTFTLSS
jgi:cyclin B